MKTDLELFQIEVELLIQAVMMKYQYDFNQYSRSSIHRRLTQALNRFSCETVSDLQKKVLRDPKFFPQLLDYMTVSTTEMFRDPTYFKSIREQVIPFLRTFPSLKVWVAGCSSGEELYSLAILFKEERLLDKTIFYATDINPNNIEKAKVGIYSRDDIQKASKNYQLSGGKSSLSEYYKAAYDAVQLDRSLINNVAFSDHSLATDAVFGEVHLVSCRNVLIYFERALQDRAIGLFKDSLVRGGFLGLGSKESLHFSDHKNQFEIVNKEDRIFQKR